MDLEKQQKMLLRIAFGLRSCDCTKNLRTSLKIPLVRELHIYEPMKLLSQVVRKSHISIEVNNYICDVEFANISNPERRIKTLKSEKEMSTSRTKTIKVRIRKLFNVLVKFDISILERLQLFHDNQLKELLHTLRDTFISDNEELMKLFW